MIYFKQSEKYQLQVKFMMSKKTEIRSELLKAMQEKYYSPDTHYNVIIHITNFKERDLAPEALQIVNECESEAEAFQLIMNLK